MTMPSEQKMRAAIAARDQAFDGRFFFGVITTGVFCRPSCTSRSARPENLRFFPNAESALVFLLKQHEIGRLTVALLRELPMDANT